MKQGYLIYEAWEAKKNERFIQMFQKAGELENIAFSFVAKEVDSKLTKISMRSKGIDVAEVCAKFGGGGHTFAAGCTIKAGVKDAVAKILREIKQ